MQIKGTFVPRRAEELSEALLGVHPGHLAGQAPELGGPGSDPERHPDSRVERHDPSNPSSRWKKEGKESQEFLRTPERS